MCVTSCRPHISAMKGVISIRTIIPSERKTVEELAHQCTGTEKPGPSGHPHSPTAQPCAGGGAAEAGIVLLFVNLTHARSIWEVGISTKEVPPSDCPVGKPVRLFLD